MTERAYTNDEIAEIEDLRASIRAIDDAPVERYRAALAVLRGDPAQQTAGSAILARADELHDLGFEGGWNAAVDECAKIALTAGCGNTACMDCYGNQIASAIRDLTKSSDGGVEGHAPNVTVGGNAALTAAPRTSQAVMMDVQAGVESCPSDTSTPQASVEGSEPIAWCGWHPKHGYVLQTAGHDQQHASSLLMRTDIAGNHGWTVQPLYAAPPSQAGMRVPDGYALVPLRPTQAMIEAGCDNNPTQWNDTTDNGFAADVANDVYVSMVRAALLSPSHSGQTIDAEFLANKLLLQMFRHDQALIDGWREKSDTKWLVALGFVAKEVCGRHSNSPGGSISND